MPPRYLLGSAQWDPAVVLHKSLAWLFIWVLGLLWPGFSFGMVGWKRESTPWKQTLLTFLFLLIRWVHPIFHWHNHLAASFISFTDLRDIIVYLEALSKFTQQAMNDSQQSISLLNTKMSLMRKTVLQNRKALNARRHLFHYPKY